MRKLKLLKNYITEVILLVTRELRHKPFLFQHFLLTIHYTIYHLKFKYFQFGNNVFSNRTCLKPTQNVWSPMQSANVKSIAQK